jgi:hypothetical protein
VHHASWNSDAQTDAAPMVWAVRFIVCICQRDVILWRSKLQPWYDTRDLHSHCDRSIECCDRQNIDCDHGRVMSGVTIDRNGLGGEKKATLVALENDVILGLVLSEQWLTG